MWKIYNISCIKKWYETIIVYDNKIYKKKKAYYSFVSDDDNIKYYYFFFENRYIKQWKIDGKIFFEDWSFNSLLLTVKNIEPNMTHKIQTFWMHLDKFNHFSAIKMLSEDNKAWIFDTLYYLKKTGNEHIKNKVNYFLKYLYLKKGLIFPFYYWDKDRITELKSNITPNCVYSTYNNIITPDSLSNEDKVRLITFFDFETTTTHEDLIFDPYDNNMASFKPYLLCYNTCFDNTHVESNCYKIYREEDCYNKITLFFKDIWDLVGKYNPNDKIYLIAHNFSGFDYWFFIKNIIDMFDKSKISVEILYHDNKMYILKIHDIVTDQTLIFICSYKLVGCSLEIFNKTYGDSDLSKAEYINKFDIKLINDYSILNKSIKDYIPEYDKDITVMDYIQKYCENDVKILIIRFNNIINQVKLLYEINEITRLEYFISSPRLTFYLWSLENVNDDENQIVNLGNVGNIDRDIRRAYYGGRTEVLQHKKLDSNNKVVIFDFSAIYGNIILQELPVGPPLIGGSIRVDQFIEYSKKYFIYCKCELKCPEDIYFPILPIKHISEVKVQKLYFPVGVIRGWYFREELELAIKNGYTVEEISFVYYFIKGTPLTKYVQKNLNFKDNFKNIDPVKSKLAKLINNALYGKFGRNQINEVVELMSLKEFHKKTGVTKVIGSHNNNMLVKIINDKNRIKSNVALAAAVTAKARILMWCSINKIITTIPEAKVMYIDTDSIFVEVNNNSLEKLNNLLLHNLGKVKYYWETQETYDDAEFLSSKFYWIIKDDNFNIKSKGFRKELSDIKKKEIIQFIEKYDVNDDTTHSITLPQIEKIYKQWGSITMINKYIDLKNTPFECPKRQILLENDKITGKTLPWVNTKKLEEFDSKLTKELSNIWNVYK